MTNEKWHQNLYQMFSDNFPDLSATFIETEDGSIITYNEVDMWSARFANALSKIGVIHGDRVLVQAHKSPEVIFLYLACLRLGAIFVPLNTAYTKNELRYFVEDSEPKLVVCDPKSPLKEINFQSDFPNTQILTLGLQQVGTLMPIVKNEAVTSTIPQGDGKDIACILYTSGTTGRPKGAMLSHANLGSNAFVLRNAWGFDKNDVLLHALPIFHAHGLFVALNTVLMNGTSMVFIEEFDVNKVCRLLPQTTVMMGVPTFYTRLLEAKEFNSTLTKHMRLFISGSAPLMAETHARFYTQIGHSILERYGMTETAMNSSNPLHGERIPGSVGPPLPGIDIRVVDDNDNKKNIGDTGNIQVRGPNVFSGYWRKPLKTNEEFCEDGFFRTGDLGYIDEDGYLFIVGRSKDLIISGGYNVYPKEVETLLDSLDGIKESAVIGVPHNDFGEGVVAIVTCNVSPSQLDENDVIAALKHNLAGYKVPKAVYFVDEIPRNVMGKVEKSKLREAYKGCFVISNN